MREKEYFFNYSGESFPGGRGEGKDNKAASEEINGPFSGSEAEEDPLPSEEKKEFSPEELQVELQKLQEENEELKNRLLRLQADFDNYRKRVRAEKEELIEFANQELIKKLLPVLDNMDRACSSSEQSVEGIREGLEKIAKQFKELLEKEGVTPIECEGEPFDPNCHEAVLCEEGSEHPSNTVVQELQKGYRMKDKVLRPSMVKVAVDE